MAGKAPPQRFYDNSAPPPPPGQAIGNYDAPGAPHEGFRSRDSLVNDVSPLNSYDQSSYLRAHSAYEPASTYEPHSVPYYHDHSPTRPDYSNPYDTRNPYESREDIPLQPQTPKGGPIPSAYGVAGPPPPQEPDAFPLNPEGARPRRSRGSMWANIPWVTYTLSLIQISVFIAEIVRMAILTGSPIETKPTFNPMIGPSPFLLINMGARYVPCMRIEANVQDGHITDWPCPNSTSTTGACTLTELCGFQGSYPVPNPPAQGPIPSGTAAPNQWFRFITPIFLHGGFIHIAGNLCLQLLLGRDMEKIIGSVRFFIVYFSAGIFGFVLGANYAKPAIASTGCSGCLFGIVGLVFIDLFYTWTTRKSPWWDLFFLVLTVVIEIVIGLLPTGLDNFSHIGGLLVGLALGVTLLHSPTALRKHYGGVEPDIGFARGARNERAKRQSRALETDDLVRGTQGASTAALFKDPVGYFSGRKPLWWFWLVLRLACLIGVVAGFIALVVNFYNTNQSNCGWCQSLSCINYKDWCSQGNIDRVTTSSAAPNMLMPRATPAPTAAARLVL